MADKPRSSASDKQKERSDKLEAQIREGERRRQERQFLEELAKRITIAREGRTFMERKQYPAAMGAYRRFLSITARSFQVEIENLSPTLFEDKNRIAESLITSSIFFDLLKMLDKLDSASAREERMLYHKLFLRFTKGMPFQHFAAENIRKHLVYSNSIVNKPEFWNTYRAIVGRSFCLVATWAFDSDHAPEVVRLRRFRDEVLWPNRSGRAFTRWYYRNGEKVVSVLAKIPGSQRAVKALVRGIGAAFLGPA
ncbi:MAG: CFI-box-CTERM domain-containing protein [Bdellovibrionota bacterium]